jgi:hypothetical protein
MISIDIGAPTRVRVRLRSDHRADGELMATLL